MKKYRKIFILGFQNALEYRVDFIIGLLSMLCPIFIQVSMWIAIYGNSKKTIIYNYTLTQMLSYVVLAGLISKAMNINVEYEIMGDIKDGGLNKFLIRPVNYLWYRIIENLGGKAVQFLIVFILIFIGLTVNSVVYKIPYTIETIVFFVFAIIFSIFLKVSMSVMISFLSFWIGETWAAFMMLDVIINIMSGGLFPLDIFGENIIRIVKFLPFQYTIYFPIRILTGHLGVNEILVGIMIQIIWIILFGVLDGFIWKKGLKAYISAGG